MISAHGLAALRVAATVAHALPGLGVRLGHEGRTVVAVDPGACGRGTGSPAGGRRDPTPTVASDADRWIARAGGVLTDGDRLTGEGGIAGRRTAPTAGGWTGLARSAEPGPAGAPLVVSPCTFRVQVARARAVLAGGRHLRLLAQPGDPTVDLAPRVGNVRPGAIVRVPVGDRWIYGFAVCAATERCHAAGLDLAFEARARLTVRSFGLRGDAELGTTLCFVETSCTDADHDAAVVDLLGSLLAVFTAEAVAAGLTGLDG